MSTAAEPVLEARSDADLYLCVALGGVVGAFARHTMDLLIPTARDGWPTSTFIVNLTGAFILGIVLVAARELAPDPTSGNVARRLRPFLVTGVLGGYTTFSSYMVQAHGLADEGQWPLTFLYVFGSLLAGVALVALAMALASFAWSKIKPGDVYLFPEAGSPAAEQRRTTEDEA